MAGRQRITDMRISDAVDKYLEKPTASQIGPIETAVEDIYKLLDANTQKRTRKQMIFKFLQKKGLAPAGSYVEDDQRPMSSQSSSSEEFGKDVEERGVSSVEKNGNKNRPPVCKYRFDLTYHL